MLRIAFIYLHPHTCDDFFSDMPFSLCSGELRARGHHCQVMHLYLDRDSEERSRALQASLVAHLQQERFDVAVFDQVWDMDLFEQVKRACRAILISTDLFARRSPHVDYLLGYFSQNQQPLLRLIEALSDQEDITKLPNVWLRRGEDLVPGEALPQPSPPGPDLPFRPDLDHLYLNPVFRPPNQRKTLCPNFGCPHGLEASANPFFRDVDLDQAFISARGCSFCHQGGNYQGRPGPESATLVLDQIQIILDRRPQIREYILRDQSCLRYLPHLFRGARQRGLPGLSILASARADHVLRFKEALQQALEETEGSAHQLHLYLIGFENLSQRVLDIYNKGMKVEDCIAAVQAIRSLNRGFAANFPLGRYKTSSFILFNPWVTLDDLQQNVDCILEHGITDFAAGIPLTKLRLYPNLPLFHRARQDGLLEETYQDPYLDNAAAAGYSAEHPWRFADPRSALVYALVSRLHPRLPQDQEIRLLQQAVVLARRLPASRLDHVDAATQELESVLHLSAPKQGHGADPIRVEDHEQRSPNTINITATCNQRCVFCAGYSFASLSDEEIRALIKGKKEVFFQGGEPTLHRSLFSFARYAREHGAETVTLVTNGLRLAYPSYVRGCLDAGIDQFFFALPSHIRETGDLLSRVPGSHQLKMRALQNLVALGAGPKVRLIHLLNRHNFAHLPGYVRFLWERFPDIPALEIKLMQCLGRVEDNWDLIPSLTELRRPLQQCLDLCSQHGLNAVVNGVPPCILPEHHTQLMDYHYRRVSGHEVTGRKFLPACKGCPLACCCLGVRIDYLKIFGPEEILEARRALSRDHAQRGGQAMEQPPRAKNPLRSSPAIRKTEEAKLHRRMAEAAAQGRHAEAGADLRLLLEVRGCEASPEQLGSGRADLPTTESLTMRGFKAAELAMLHQGLKPVVKMEDIEEEAAALFFQQNRQRFHLARSAPYVRDDLAIDQRPATQGTEPPAQRLVTIYASRGDEAYRLQNLDRAGPRQTDREAGALLGYPSCCVEHFAQVSSRSHEARQGINEALLRSLWRRTPQRHLALPWQTSLFADDNLLSFYPCSFRCSEALAWADQVLAAVEADDLIRAAAIHQACARPVLFFRLPFFVLFDGRVEQGSLFYRRFAVNTFGSPATRRLQRLFCADIGRLLLAGDRLTVTRSEISIARGDRLVGRLSKDHPEACLLLDFQ